MADLLVRLYDFEYDWNLEAKLAGQDVVVRRAMAPERSKVLEWVAANFERGWADECAVAFSRMPISCFLAVRGKEILGFSCCESICRDFFGPTGVHESARGLGLGKALLQIALVDLKNRGYGYAIIGDAGPVGFYKKFCGATEIKDSVPGIYRGLL